MQLNFLVDVKFSGLWLHIITINQRLQYVVLFKDIMKHKKSGVVTEIFEKIFLPYGNLLKALTLVLDEQYQHFRICRKL